MRKIILSILLLLFLFSCSESDEIEVLYRSGDYEAALERSNELLGNQLSENALYWKMLSSWALSMNDDASDAASLYLLLYPEEDDSHHLMVLRAVLFLDNNKAKAIEAGKELYLASLLGKAGASRLYKLLCEAEDPMADELYSYVRPLLTSTENAYLLIDSEASSEMIILALEAMYEDRVEDELYADALNEALFLFMDRNEEDMIVSLALSTAPEDPELSITIGDLLYSLGDYRKAAEYWAKGREKSPEGYRIRMRLLGSVI